MDTPEKPDPFAQLDLKDVASKWLTPAAKSGVLGVIPQAGAAVADLVNKARTATGTEDPGYANPGDAKETPYEAYAKKLDGVLGIGEVTGVRPQVIENWDKGRYADKNSPVRNQTSYIVYDFSDKSLPPEFVEKLRATLEPELKKGNENFSFGYDPDKKLLTIPVTYSKDKVVYGRMGDDPIEKLSGEKKSLKDIVDRTLKETQKTSEKTGDKSASADDKKGSGETTDDKGTPPPEDEPWWKKAFNFMGNNKGMAIGGVIGLLLGSFLGPIGMILGALIGGWYGAVADGKDGVFKVGDNTEAAKKLGMTTDLHKSAVEYAKVRFTDKSGHTNEKAANQFMKDLSQEVAGKPPEAQNEIAAKLTASTAEIRANINEAKGYHANRNRQDMERALGQAKAGMRETDQMIGIDRNGPLPNFSNIKMPPQNQVQASRMPQRGGPGHGG